MTHENLIERLEEINNKANAKKLKSFLLPENGNGPIPPGERYWLGQEGCIPDECIIFEKIGAVRVAGQNASYRRYN